MKKVFYLTGIFALCFALLSCSKEDVATNKFVGKTWVATIEGDVMAIKFFEDNTFRTAEKMGDKYYTDDTGVYTVTPTSADAGTVVLKENDDIYTETYSYSKLTKDSMTWESRDPGSDVVMIIEFKAEGNINFEPKPSVSI